MGQLDLLPGEINLPDGFLYRADFIPRAEEVALVTAIAQLEFTAVVMRGVAAKRRTAHFGRSYEFQTFKIGAAPPIPEFLLPYRARAAALTSHPPEGFAEALVSEYPPGAAIGWHRDAPPFGVIVGISLLTACTMKFRPWPVPAKGMGDRSKAAKPLARLLEPCSAYVLDGAARTSWQHHIPPTPALRYSITFRTLRSR
jgi:alkylated DNA repair dioxygenase AlkB